MFFKSDVGLLFFSLSRLLSVFNLLKHTLIFFFINLSLLYNLTHVEMFGDLKRTWFCIIADRHSKNNIICYHDYRIYYYDYRIYY